MKSMKKSTIIIIVVIALLAIWGVTGYNGLVLCFIIFPSFQIFIYAHDISAGSIKMM